MPLKKKIKSFLSEVDFLLRKFVNKKFVLILYILIINNDVFKLYNFWCRWGKSKLVKNKAKFKHFKI